MGERYAFALRVAAVALALPLAAACSEADRKAWVSILPGGEEDGEAAPDTVAAPPGLALSGDSTAVLLDGDSLMTIERLPDRGPGGVDVRDATFRRVEISPDSLYVAFVLDAETPVAGIWTRARQSARFVVAPGGPFERLEWSPGGRFLVWQAAVGEATTVGAYDLRLGARARHPVVSWLERQQRSVRLQDWIDERRLRLLVAPGAEPRGGLAWVWEMHGGSLMVEDQVEPLARSAPPESQLLAGGAFSADLLGDPVPESIALYVSSELEPSALVLRNRGDEYAATTTEPLVPLEVLGLESWEGIRRGAELEEIVEVDGRPLLLVAVPVPDDPVKTLGFFEVEPDGRVTLVPAGQAGEESPALFPEGRTAERIFDIGLMDLDGDGGVEVISATGRQDPDALVPRVRWGAQVWRWAPGPRLVQAPDLVGRAIEALERMTGTGASTGTDEGPLGTDAAPAESGSAAETDEAP